MEQQDYNNTITVKAAPADAFAAIANVAAWWTKSFKGNALANGDTFTVQFGDTTVSFSITDAKPDLHITWLVTDCHLPWLKNKTEWTGTSINWHIEPHNGKTTISMTHVGLVPQIECYEGCRSGWNKYFAGSLAQLLNTGAGLPD